MGLPSKVIIPVVEQIVSLSGDRVDMRGYVNLYTKFGEEETRKTIKVRYFIIDTHTSYNMLLERPSLNRLGVILSTPHLTMKFPAKNERITRVRVHQRKARECYDASLKIPPRYKLRKKEVNMIAGSCNLDPRPSDESRVEPRDETLLW